MNTFILKSILITLTAGALVAASVTPLILPNSTLTPGMVNTDPKLTLKKLCVSGYTASAGIRAVPEKVHKQVFAEYNIDPKSDKYEVDHLISLELGGTNDIKNLWPQSYTTVPYNAHIKDHLENELHKRVCKLKTMQLKDAQFIISHNWVDGYKKYYCTNHIVKDDSCK